MRDPKFGYGWLWILPLFLVMGLLNWIIQRPAIMKRWWTIMMSKELRRARKIAGIKK